jgi:hypothetical protein
VAHLYANVRDGRECCDPHKLEGVDPMAVYGIGPTPDKIQHKTLMWP